MPKTIFDSDAHTALVLHPSVVTDEIREYCKEKNVELVESDVTEKEVAIILDLEKMRDEISNAKVVFKFDG